MVLEERLEMCRVLGVTLVQQSGEGLGHVLLLIVVKSGMPSAASLHGARREGCICQCADDIAEILSQSTENARRGIVRVGFHDGEVVRGPSMHAGESREKL